jgi:hypothetical protein
MKLLVLCDSAGNIQSVAVPNPELPGKLQIEVEGGPTARELEVDEGRDPAGGPARPEGR